MSSQDGTEVSGTDIAIVGMAGRFPGADSVGEFWELLRAGREGIARFSDEELAGAGIPAALRADPAYVPAHGILPDVDLFDTGFFELTPAEAEVIDPQQRLFLQSCHTALEDAGYDPRRYDGLISVYGGAAINTYLQQNVLPRIDQTATSDHFKVMVGNDKDFLATRVSYKLDLRGPSYSVQTACSTSLVAIHLACQGLVNGECDMALAGGVTVKLPQTRGYLYEEGAILSADGRVRTFDADASGTVLGNGVGIVVLKLLEDAVNDGDTIHAVIKGTATNNDGSLKVSYAAPGKEGQAAVIAEAHAVSGTEPRSVTYVEAHGTATRLGDPVEVSALTDAFRRGTQDTGFCAIGSLKSNVGHLDAAAGVAGVIKTALMLRHRALVPTLNYERPNPAIDFPATPFYVSTETTPWTADGPLRAGVSSFGIGGTNAHAVLQEAPRQEPSGPSGHDAHVLVLSAKTGTALETLTDALADHLDQHPDTDLADAAYTLAVGRQAHRYRRAVLAADRAEAVRLLRERSEPGCVTGDGDLRGGQRTFTPDGEPSGRELLEAVRTAWLDGAEVDWATLYADERRRRIPLPTYPFEGRRVWLDPEDPDAPDAADRAPARLHPLIGANVSTLAEHRYATALTGREFYLAGHRVGGEAIMPAVGYLEMARAAGALALPTAGSGGPSLHRVAFERPLSFAGGPRTVHIRLLPHGDGARFAIADGPGGTDGEPEVFARGELTVRPPAAPPAPVDPAALTERCPDRLAAPELYALLRDRGLDYGPAMRALRVLHRGDAQALGVLELPELPELAQLEETAEGFGTAGSADGTAPGDAAGFVLHPSLLDGALHAVVGLLAAGEDEGTTYLPLALGGLEVFAPLPRHCLAHVTLLAAGSGEKQTKAQVDVLDPEGRLLARLRDLSVRTVRDDRRKPESALFGSAWEPAGHRAVDPTASDPTASAPTAPVPAGPRLLLAHDPARRSALTEELRAAGDGEPDVVLVTPGAEFTAVDGDHYTVDPASQADFAAILDHLAESGRTPTTVLHTWCDDAATDATQPLTPALLDHGLPSVFALTKALLERRGADRTTVLVAHRTDADGASPAAAALTGLARSVTLENPRLLHRLVGLDADAPVLRTLVAELTLLEDGETETRYADGIRQVRRHRRLDAVPAAADGPAALRDGGVYLLTGGAGRLGLTLAEHLAHQVTATLVLTGRTEPGPEAERRIADLRATGCEVVFRRADVADEESLDELLTAVRADHGPLRGVLHAAGTLHDGFLLRKSWEEFTEVVRPKVHGTVHLDRLTAGDPLDFFVCFSSIAGVFGNPGQSDYAYANAFLDAFAERRRAQVADGRRPGRTVSLAWPLWRDGGMRQDEDAARALRHRLGLVPMPTADGLAAFDAALRQDGGAVLVGYGDPDRVAAALAPTPVRTVARPSAAPGTARTELSEADLTAWVGTFLRELLAETTKLDPAELDLRVPFDRYGIDSLVITALNAELDRHFDALPKTLFFEYATLEELAGYFVAEHAARLRELAGPAGSDGADGSDGAAAEAETAEVAGIVDGAGAGTAREEAAPVAARTAPAAPAPAPDAPYDDAVAVIGLTGRYPMADDLDAFWQNLADGRDCITEIPADRWDHARYFDPDPSARGRASSKWGGFLRDIDRFDPLFFGISPREAELMDPQERLFLQTSWHVLEDAGYRRDALSEHSVGVFVGVMYGEYQLYGAADAERGGIRVTGSSFASIANRVSYTLGLTGPSIALDTMCSSSLTAIHLACESLRRAESEVAIAGGVNLSLHPYKYVFLSQGRFVSADGRCRAFGAGGSGYVPGEGVGAVLLKPLAAAVRDGDHIYGVIRGHAVNHGGRTNGYTVPNPHAQADAVRRALHGAGLEPSDIGYVEAHGTGTSLGDPIEIAGLAKVFGTATPDGHRWPIGSVKSNIGHLESAAGIAGLTKVLLQFRHRQLVPSLHSEELNPNIDFGRAPFRVQRAAADWPEPDAAAGPSPRRAGLSSFGAGGSNAHLVLEEYRDGPARTDAPVAGQRFARPLVFPLSARDTERLDAYADHLADFTERAHVRAEDLAHTLQHGREVWEERLAVVAEDGATLVRALRAHRAGTPDPALLRGGATDPAPQHQDDPAAALAARWTHDGTADWDALRPGDGAPPRRIPAPHYPFARERYWVPAADRSQHGPAAAPARPHPLLDANESTLDEVRFRRTFHADEPLVRDHLIDGRPLLAGAACLEMARAAAELAGLADAHSLRDVLWGRPVVIEDRTRDVFVTLARPAGRSDATDRELAFTVWTPNGAERTVHVRGTVGAPPPAERSAPADLDALRAACPQHRDGAAVQDTYRAARFAYGTSFDVIEDVHFGPGGALVRLALPETDAAPAELLPPALLDGALRACHWADLPRPAEDRPLAVPFSLGALEVRAPREPLPRICYAHAVPVGDADPASGLRQFDVRILDASGTERVRIENFGGRHLGAGADRLPADRLPADPTGTARPATADDPFFYQQVWQDQDLPSATRADGDADAVLVLGDGGNTTRALAAQGGGRRVIDVRAATDFARTGPDQYTVDPTRSADFARLLTDLGQEGVRSLDVVHLWGLTTEPVDYGTGGATEQAGAALDAAFARGLHALRALVRAVDTVRPAGRVRCAYVLAEDASGPRPDQEAAAGFARSLTGVLPGCELFTVTCADGLADGPALPGLLTAELAQDGRPAGTEVRYGAQGRQVRVLRRVDASVPPAGDALPLKRHGSYLVTGGTGGIGLELVRHLASVHQARLVLVSRSADRPAARAAADELVALGAEVLLVAADTADPEGMRSAVTRATERFGHLDGVFHLAGAADTATVLEADRARFTELLATKAHGVRLLDALTADQPLDLFVVFSSIASVVGDFGTCAYAAANRFLDSYAAQRDARVRAGQATGRTLAPAWPLWRIGGVDALMGEEERAGYRRRTGMREFSAAEGLRALELAGRTGLVRLVPALGDLAAVDAALTPRTGGAGAGTPAGGPPPAAGTAPATGADPTAAALLAQVGEHVRGLLSEVLGLAAERIDPDTPLDAYGLDSVLVMETNAHLDRDFPGARATLLFEYRTVHDLAQYLLREHADAVRTLFPAAPREEAARADRAAAEERPTPNPAPAVPTQGPAPADDDIAIIGISGRYPQARDLTEFWENLRQGRDAVTEVPRDRWDADAHFDGDPATPGTSYGKWGGFLSDVDAFDSLFFRIPPSQAKLMDPQERLFLEAAWSALENAGYPPSRLPRPRYGGQGRDVGVFAGVMWGDYAQLAAEESAHGNHHTVLANRSAIANQVSYAGDFRGPSVVVDTACSASLVALHQACESVRRGECRYALAGGVNVSAHPLKYAHLSRMRMLATDGRCRSFGAGGDGYVPGEGVGAVLLKRLSEAVADGDHIHAVIKATAVNHGGRTGGYTVPNPQAQQALIEEALDRAGIDPRTIGYVEAHGTGTALGDPIEHTALALAFARSPQPAGGHVLGSVKSNIGHLEGAAGIAGVTKAVLQLAHGELVPSLHSEELNPHIDFARSPFRVQRTLAPWPRPVVETDRGPVEQPRRASVSSFGAGGTNAHVILEEYRAPADRPTAASDGPELMVLSARSPERLRAYAAELAAFLRRERPALAEAAHTLRAGREALPERLAFLASDLTDAAEKFAACADGAPGTWAVLGNAEQHAALADVFTGGAGPDFLQTLAAGGDRTRLARLWVSGAFSDWTAVDAAAPHPHRTVPLPSYPFERARHWLPTTRGGQPAAPAGPRPVGSRPDAPHEASHTLTPADPVVRDHVVHGTRVLPGVGHLGLVAGALGDGAARVFRDVRWLSPVLVPERGTALTLTFGPGRPTPEGDGTAHDYRISAAPGGDPVHSVGQVLDTAPDHPAPLALDLIRADCPHRVGHEELYAGLRRRGLHYGPYFRRVEQVWTGERTVLARLRAPEPQHRTTTRPDPLDPGALDAALHPLALLLGDAADAGGRALLPFAADRIERHAPVPGDGWSCIRALGSHRFDVTVADDTGRVCVRILGLVLRPSKATAGIDYRPRWAVAPRTGTVEDAPAPRTVLTVAAEQAAPLADALERAHPGAEHVRLTLGAGGLGEQEVADALARAPRTDLVYFLGVDTPGQLPDSAEELSQAQDRGVVSLHRLVRGLDRAGLLDRPLRLKVLTADGLPLGETDRVHPPAAGLIGYCEVATKEFPQLNTACLDVRGTELADGVRALVEEPARAKARPVSLRGHVRRERRLERVELPAAPPRFRDRGVYLVLGGLGVLGRDTARYLARTYRARLVLVGRGPLDAERSAFLAELEQLGGEVLYTPCDAADAVALRQVVDEAKARFGALHGVIHSAMVLVDRPIRDLDEAQLRSALTAKADTVRSMFHALRGEPLDFALLYSSAVTLEGNHGQAGYAAGCHIADAWALAAAQTVPYPVRIINWGYWHAAGDAHRERVLRRFAAAGIRPIGADEGLAAVERVLSGALSQLLVVKAEPGILAGLGVDPDTVLRPQPGPTPAPAAPAVDPAGPDETGAQQHVPDGPDASAEASAETERLARSLLVGALRTRGVLHRPGERHTRAGLCSRLGVAAGQERLLDLLVDVLLRGGYLRAEGDQLVATDRLDDADLRGCLDRPEAAADHLTGRHPSTGPVVTLLRRCLDALPAVLTGARSHLEVLFPGGSFDLVEAVYAGDPAAGRCNDQVAGTVLRYVAERLRRQPGDRIRVLEVGAGTGGTSEGVLRRLADAGHGAHVEYVYTDVSDGFVRHGRRRFGADHPFAAFRVLDIERDPAAQGFEAGGYDLVLGTNVFHATSRIDRTLAHTKQLLRTNGLLVVNEGVELRDQMSLIFGLATGWWLFEDAEYRLPRSPLLGLTAWRDVLAQNGFRSVTARPRPGGAGGATYQRVLVAESDGLVPVPAVGPAPAAGPEPTARPAQPPAAAPAPAPGDPAAPDPVRAAELRVRAVFARVLEMSEDLLDPTSTFENYGVDSLVALTLTKELEPDFGPLPTTLLFEHITIERLARHLATLGTGPTGPAAGTGAAADPPPAPATTAPGTPDNGLAQIVGGLSDAEVDRLLHQLSTVLQEQEEQR
ncbi:SDR family NAD(P)-dependent oxidoreductase [Streptomyces sp. RGM 3693]|uniref:SDR family NAD(P)-dependent oxidoreductase n=1 Tax=Streptomyces sp. RGM 3693 TaxID=3413284 RepID=UPI003D28ABC6